MNCVHIRMHGAKIKIITAETSNLAILYTCSVRLPFNITFVYSTTDLKNLFSLLQY